jgi:hypothetical protein
MKTIHMNITEDTADALLLALREYVRIRTFVREYVDKRYVGMDEAFRNRKIGEVQTRLDRLQSFIDRLQTQVIITPEGESK